MVKLEVIHFSCALDNAARRNVGNVAFSHISNEMLRKYCLRQVCDVGVCTVPRHFIHQDVRFAYTGCLEWNKG